MKSFQTYTPRVRRLVYDALIADLGCQAITGGDFRASKAFARVCIVEHDSGNVTFNRSDKVAYATGPLNTGDAPPWVTRWVAWIASKGIRVAKRSSIVPPSDGIGIASSLFPTVAPPPTKVALGFTSQGQMGIAIQKNATSIQVKWFKTAEGTYGDTTFTGTSPAMLGNTLLHTSDEAGENDLVLYYLRPEIPRSLFARFEVENFASEHLVHSDLPVKLSKLIGSEVVGIKQELYAVDISGRDVTFYSPEYPVSITDDRATLKPSIYRGSYRQAAAATSITTGNKASLSLAIVSGSYNDIIVEPAAPLSGDAESLSIAIESGSYE